jgi:hypothetical protein
MMSSLGVIKAELSGRSKTKSPDKTMPMAEKELMKRQENFRVYIQELIRTQTPLNVQASPSGIYNPMPTAKVSPIATQPTERHAPDHHPLRDSAS